MEGKGEKEFGQDKTKDEREDVEGEVWGWREYITQREEREAETELLGIRACGYFSLPFSS